MASPIRYLGPHGGTLTQAKIVLPTPCRYLGPFGKCSRTSEVQGKGSTTRTARPRQSVASGFSVIQYLTYAHSQPDIRIMWTWITSISENLTIIYVYIYTYI